MLLFEKLKSGEAYKAFIDDYGPELDRLCVVFESDLFYIGSSNIIRRRQHDKHNFERGEFIHNIYYHPDLDIVKKSANYEYIGYVLDNLADIQLELSIENRKRKIEKLLKYEY